MCTTCSSRKIIWHWKMHAIQYYLKFLIQNQTSCKCSKTQVVIIFLFSKQHIYIPSNFTVKEIYHETMKLNSAGAINIGLNYIPASCSLEVLLASLLCRMGLPYLAWNCFSVPRNPGIRKSKRDHRSRTLFWMGVPDRIKRWLQTNCFTALESWNHKRYTVYSGLQLKSCVKE